MISPKAWAFDFTAAGAAISLLLFSVLYDTFHADAKRLYIMRGNSRVYHIAQRYIIKKLSFIR